MVEISIDYSLFAYPKPNNKSKTSKRVKATEIDMKLKKIVWERDKHKCIFCGKIVPVNCANAHFIKRSQGGLGIEKNIFTTCPECHHEEDNGKNSKLYVKKAKTYLKRKYKDWNEKELFYNKYN